ncbi:MAG TPA: DegV family protein [Erysipelotrichaceae bacterium]|nr:DegV family protein [Erysipelotrichaceae bacterium]
MKAENMTSENLYSGFLAGANEVIKQKLELNKINVFPVADGDTGTNMAYTMNSIIQNSKVKENAKATLQTIADAALIGARGNSGIIFAQFVNGMFIEIKNLSEIDISSFSQAANKAVKYAYEAIAEPVEGTMITVMRDWAASLNNNIEKTEDFKELFVKSYKDAYASLLNTPNLLKVLKENNVVDSGAKGFVHFIEGFSNYLNTGKVEQYSEKWEKFVMDDDEVHFHSHFDLVNRYCTEALVQGENLNLEKIREELKLFGDSLIVAGNQRTMRIHIHTLYPEAFFAKLKDYGQIVFQKVDDMQRQYETLYDRASEIALVTDSIADLPQEYIDKYQIHLFPLNLLINDSNYLDKLTITPEYFYDLMDSLDTYPSSAQPALVDVENFLKPIVSNYKKVIIVTVSKQMSGTFNTFSKAVHNLNLSGDQVTIVDSKVNSGAQGLVVLEAAKAIAAKKSFEEVLAVLDKTIKNAKIYVSVPTLEYMYKSGRIGKAQQIALNMVNLKPVVSIDENGDGIIIGKAFSVRGNTRKIESLVKDIRKTADIKTYSLVHARADKRLEEFVAYYEDLIGFKPEYIMEISPVVALNAGIGSVAISLIKEERGDN